jgi:membrane associated rhomboid family serine protease
MIPLKDENPTRRVAWLTLALIAGNFWVYAWEVHQSSHLLVPLASPALRAVVQGFGVIPARLAALQDPARGALDIGALLTLVTSTFLHGSLLHLLGNMLYLWIFGNNVENAMGPARFLVFYFLCGGVAALSQVVADPASALPMVGASGAIAGVLGAYLVLFPRANVLVLVWLLIFVRVVRVPALLMLGLWFVYQLAAAGRGGSGIAWYAHIGGFLVGALLAPVLARPARRRWRR